jgi:nucleoside-diphosphate-sugar epimerase
MKITITGGTGFVGTNLQSYLKTLYEIEAKSVRYEANQKLVLKSDTIIHLSGKAHDLKKVSNAKEYYDANFELTKQLFDAFLVSDAQDFIFMSSVKAVADALEDNDMLNEDVKPNPQTHYGKSKLLAENYILSKNIPSGKRVFIFRPSMIHGPGNKGNLNLLDQFVVKGLPWPLGAFENQRSFCSVDNLCYVIKQILENEKIPSGIYNVADDEPLSTNEVIQLIAKSNDKKARILSISRKLIFFIAKIGDVLRLPLNTERLNKLTENFIVSNSKIKAALQIEYLPISSREGIVKTINTF